METKISLIGASIGSDIVQSNSERIYRTSVKDGMPELLASLLVGQSKFETNKYVNKHCQLHNAYFSYMYDPGSKWQVKGGGSLADNGAPVAKYLTLENSVHEMTAWIGRRQLKPRALFKTDQEYQRYLNKGIHLLFPFDLTRITDAEQYAKLLYACTFYQGWKRYTPEQNIDYYANGIDRYKESF